MVAREDHGRGEFQFCFAGEDNVLFHRALFQLLNSSLELDARPEYVRARIISMDGKLYAEVTGNQMSSRLSSIAGADVLLHLPGATADNKIITAGTPLTASILKQHFISRYHYNDKKVVMAGAH